MMCRFDNYDECKSCNESVKCDYFNYIGTKGVINYSLDNFSYQPFAAYAKKKDKCLIFITLQF